MKNLFPLETEWLQDEIWKPLVTPYYDLLKNVLNF